MLKQAVQAVLGTTGYQISKLAPPEKNPIYNPDVFPIELDEADRSIFHYVRGNHLTMVTNARLYSTLLSCRHVIDANIPGDFVECGVWRGGNAILAADAFKRLAPMRSVYGFDTFSGMTEPTEADVNLNGNSARSIFDEHEASGEKWAISQLDEVKSNFDAKGLLTSSLKLIAGDVMQTLSDPANLPDQIAILRLDTDWYESTKKELEVLYPRLSPGGILTIDDYGHWGGSRKAVDEYFAGKPKPFFHAIDYSGRCAVKAA